MRSGCCTGARRTATLTSSWSIIRGRHTGGRVVLRPNPKRRMPRPDPQGERASDRGRRSHPLFSGPRIRYARRRLHRGCRDLTRRSSSVQGDGCTLHPERLTPTEIWRALEMGADFVRIPAEALGGPRYVHSLRETLPARCLVGAEMPLDNYLSYLEAGVEVLEFKSSLG